MKKHYDNFATISNSRTYFTRHDNSLRTEAHRTSFFDKSVVIGEKLFNRLPNFVVEASTIHLLKLRLKQMLTNKSYNTMTEYLMNLCN